MPDYGFILNEMMYTNGDTIRLDRFIQLKIEFEIAFVLKKELKGPGVTIEDVMDALYFTHRGVSPK
ncbi:hypothetical protein [Paenibacillus agricola]|uniref:Uncharacterized protein n=1 Tax=Paenibacillus agricola TaxID=2716264 RepID=A0ABX0IY09_9BACL|nr:hypothetical protein [Paenibacillus agricola]NHN28837.1 hypothetical protein [Paenibacillus agricola]